MFQTMSDIEIAKSTGIPRSTVGFVRRGERFLPSKYSLPLRAGYEREGYRRMRATGFSRAQADRFKWYAPESVGLKISEMKLTVNKLTLGVTGQQIEKLKREGKSFDRDDIWGETKIKIIEGLQRSKKPVEDIGEY